MQQEDEKVWRTGSKMPAPGHTMSALPNPRTAASNVCSRFLRFVTLVCWKIALAGEFRAFDVL